MASLESRKPGRLLQPECIQTVLYSEYNDVAGDFEEVAITNMQYNLSENEQIYSVGVGPNSSRATLLIYDCLDND